MNRQKKSDLKGIASIKTCFNLNLKKIIYRAGCHLGPPGLGGSAGVGLMVRATVVVRALWVNFWGPQGRDPKVGTPPGGDPPRWGPT